MISEVIGFNGKAFYPLESKNKSEFYYELENLHYDTFAVSFYDSEKNIFAYLTTCGLSTIFVTAKRNRECGNGISYFDKLQDDEREILGLQNLTTSEINKMAECAYEKILKLF